MKKKTKQITVTEYTFSGREAEIVKHCINYGWHRLTYHDSGLEGLVSQGEIANLKEQL